MVVEIRDGEPWDYSPPSHANVNFASASSEDQAWISVRVNGEEYDRVHLRVPHSWWTATSQPLFPSLTPGDAVCIEAMGGLVVLRIDLHEYE